MRAGGGNVDVDAAGQTTSGSQYSSAATSRPAHHAVYRDEDLYTMADGEDRLAGLVEVADDRLHALVDADVFRAAPAGAINGVVFGGVNFSECLVELIVVAELLGIGLVTLEIVK